MRGARKVALAVPALIAAAACLPRRDNPFDPAHAPHAQLIVREPDDCATFDPAATYPAVASAPHGHCIELDASASADPQSGTSGLSYRFTRVGDPAPLATGASPVALVPGSYLQPLPLGGATFRVDVADSGGDVGFTEATIELTNSKPVARTDPPRTFPEWGFPWAFQVPFTVDFHGSGTDADGDPIVAYCWTPPLGTKTCGPDPTISGFSIDSMAVGRTIATLTVKDALGAESDPVDAVVEISEPNLWVGGYPNSADPAGIARLDQDRQTAGSTVTQLIPVPNAFIQGNLAMIDLGAGALELVGQDGNVLSPAGPVPNGPDAMEMDPDDTIRVLSKTSGTTRDVLTWSAASGLLVADAQHPSVAVVTSGLEDVQATQVQPAGTQSLPGGFIAFDGTQLWYGTNEARHVYVAATDGSALASDALPPGTALTGLSRRPGTADVWAVEGQDLSDGQFGTIALVRYRWNGTLQRQAWPLAGVPDAHGVVWGDADHFWTYRDGIGVCRFDADVIEAAGPDAPAAVDSCTAATSFSIAGGATPSGGSWWQDAQFATLLESEPGAAGVMTPSHALVQARTQFFDWSIQEAPNDTIQPIVRTRTEAYDGVMFRDQNTSPQTRPDWCGGGFWEIDTAPPRLRRRAEDGTVIDEITRLRLPDGVTEVPMRQILQLTSDSAGLWAYEAFDTSAFRPYLARIDLRTRPAPGEAQLAFENPTGFFIDGLPGAVFEARKTGSPGVWGESVPLFGGAPTLQLVGATGTATAVFTVPVAETTAVFASVDEYDGSLFLATISSGPTLHMRRFSSTGTLLTTYATIALAANTVLKDMRVSVDRGVASIFTVTEVPGASPNPPTMTVTAYDLNMTAKNSYSEAGPSVLAVAGETRDEIWILRSGPATFGTPERISFFGSSAPPSADLLGTGDVLQYFLTP